MKQNNNLLRSFILLLLLHFFPLTFFAITFIVIYSILFEPFSAKNFFFFFLEGAGEGGKEHETLFLATFLSSLDYFSYVGDT